MKTVWTTAGTNRVCGRCLALKDTVVGYTDESGVTIPPLHPRCRCAIMYDEVGRARENSKPRRVPALTQTTENAIVYDNGIHNGYRIDFELIGTKAYHDKFENLTKRKAVNESLYKQALNLLGRRSGTEYEETVILNARTGKLLVENADLVGMVPMVSVLSEEQKNYLEKLGESFVALHNHPNNSFPSPDDIKTLFVRNLEIGSAIVCHDGKVYFLEKLKPFSKIKELVEAVRQETQNELMGYPEHVIEKETSKRVIGRLARKKFLKFKEMS